MEPPLVGINGEAERLAQVLQAVPRGVNFERRERIAQRVIDVISKANFKELCLARARLTDWLVYCANWIAANPELAKTHEGIQLALIRGELVQAAIASYQGKSRGFLGRDREAAVREHVVDQLCGFAKNWQRNAKGG